MSMVAVPAGAVAAHHVAQPASGGDDFEDLYGQVREPAACSAVAAACTWSRA